MRNKNVTIQLITFPYTILVLSLSLLICSCIQPKEKDYTIGIINPHPGLAKVSDGFIAGLNSIGYTEGKNIRYIRHEQRAGMEAAAGTMAAQNADLIFTVTTPATIIAMNAVKEAGIPIIFGSVFDPVHSGIVKSISVPGGNVSGIQIGGSTLKALDWLLKIAPDTKQIFVPVSFDTEAAHLSLLDLKKGTDKLNIRLTVAEVASKEELQEALSSMPEDTDALFVLNSILIVSNLQMTVNKAIEMKLPIGSGAGQYINGVTVSYGQDHYASGRQASRLAHKILRGASPGYIPVEMSDYYLGINLRTATASGLFIPDDILQQADDIVR